MSKSRQAGRSSSQAEVPSAVSSVESSFLLTHRSTWGMEHRLKNSQIFLMKRLKIYVADKWHFSNVSIYVLSSLNLNVEFFLSCSSPLSAVL